MRLTAITAAQRRLLTALTGRISTRLVAEFETRSRPESPNVGVTLAERGKRAAWRFRTPCSKRPSRT